MVTQVELAKAMRVSRWTVSGWKQKGSKFEFGKHTTPGHCRAWLRANAQLLKPKSHVADKNAERLEAKLAELN